MVWNNKLHLTLIESVGVCVYIFENWIFLKNICVWVCAMDFNQNSEDKTIISAYWH